jgi:hypothetical protein
VREDNSFISRKCRDCYLGIGGFALLARSLPLEVFGEWVLFIAAGSLLKCLDLVLLTQA